MQSKYRSNSTIDHLFLIVIIGKSAASESLMAALLLACRLHRLFHVIINNFSFLVEFFNFRLTKFLFNNANITLRSKSIIKDAPLIVQILRKIWNKGRGRGAVSLHFFFHLFAKIASTPQMQGCACVNS